MVWGRAIEVDWRSVPERFIVDNEFDYFRCRNRFRVKHARHQDVGGGGEIFVDANGARSARYSVGLRRTFRGIVDTLSAKKAFFFVYLLVLRSFVDTTQK